MYTASSECQRKESLGSDTCDALVSLQGLNLVTREYKPLTKGSGIFRFKMKPHRMRFLIKLCYNVRQGFTVYIAARYFLLSITLLTRSLKSQAQETVNYETTTQC